MKLICPILLSALLVSFLMPPSTKAAAASKLRVVVVTGGHDFEQEPFFKLFKDNSEITYQAVAHPKAHALLKKAAASDWDVLVLYDMYQDISDEAKADLVARLNEGKGLVVLHHAIASYQKWPEYSKIIGAKYYLQKTLVDGVEKPASFWEHDHKFNLHIADPAHPVTKGIRDFEIHDEVYNLFDVAPDVHPLVTTDEPKSNKLIGWCKTYGPARVVYLQSGHDHFAYENLQFQQMLKQAIRWTAKK